MGTYQQFKQNKDTAVIDYGDGGKFKVRRYSERNKALQAAQSLFHKQHKHQMETDSLPPEVGREANMNWFIEYSLISWTGVTDEKGKEIECTPENAKKLFTECFDLFNDLFSQAQSLAAFQTVENEEDSKN